MIYSKLLIVSNSQAFCSAHGSPRASGGVACCALKKLARYQIYLGFSN